MLLLLGCEADNPIDNDSGDEIGCETDGSVDNNSSSETNANVPTLIINTTPFVNEIPSKAYYLDATFELNGHGYFEDIPPTPTTIKGRGNTTWPQLKKPYRLKFPSKISLCGLTKAKSYTLLANYFDPTLMRNAIALKIAQLLDMPYTNHCIPVNVILNGIYKGSYQLTEHIGINAASVDIKKSEGILFELDNNYDEEYKFHSSVFNLPVMVKDPDLNELAQSSPTVSANQLFDKWQKDFQAFENSINDTSQDFTNYLDLESFVNYMIVYNLTGNFELQHPKSTFLYKENIDSKYKFGPVWDFDWGFGILPNQLLFRNYTTAGTPFFTTMMRDSRFLTMYKEKWHDFKTNKLPELWIYFDEYIKTIELSAAQNGEIWPGNETSKGSDTFDENVEKLRTWIIDRINYINTHQHFGLY